MKPKTLSPEESERIEYLKKTPNLSIVKVIKTDNRYFNIGDEGMKSRNGRNRMLCAFHGRLIWVPYTWLTSEAYEIFKRLKNDQ